MRVLFMAKQTASSLPSLQYLIKKGISIEYAVIRESDTELKSLCEENHIAYGDEEGWWTHYAHAQREIDWLLSFYWKRVGKKLLDIPQKGCINFHPGPLPEARGSGYHVAILYDWGYWGVTAHYMDEDFDTGCIIKCEKFTISKHVINRELVKKTHEKLYGLFTEVIDQLYSGGRPQAIAQGNGTYFSLHDLELSKYIDQDDTSEQIDRKIRAFWNPPHSGATVVIKGKEYTLVDKEILQYIDDHTKD